MNSPELAQIRNKNSTTGRSYALAAPLWLKTGLRTLNALAPHTAAGVLQRLFTTPPKLAPRADEAATLSQAKRWRTRVRGMQMAGYEWGDSGPAVLLIHGWGGHAGHMTGMVAPLLKAGLRAIAVDVPGHGNSTYGRSSILHFHEAIEDMAAHAGQGQIKGIISHSFGAVATTYALSRGLDIPRAVYVGPLAQFEQLWRSVQLSTGVSRPQVERMISRLEAHYCVDFAELEPVTLARDLTTPLLVLHDEGDDKVAVSQGELLVASWPGATLRTTTRLGHLKILKDEATVTAAVEFLTRQG
ncbi:alpha/beta fold hydrolase [Andreprevotia chitinilytica]|uniref:alpha/beta fold hydrolase n=1 Tax=Andreprevotia chitinilytica TaxID=396808 RepID=UPI00054FAC28|nr:alpha/beta hydrolase [Andreprevotia chitinilytica]